MLSNVPALKVPEDEGASHLTNEALVDYCINVTAFPESPHGETEDTGMCRPFAAMSDTRGFPSPGLNTITP